ncbi:MAG: membrane protein insertase YidC [Nitrospirae bacterium]|nr:membrane protein insertase YidC [Nitrospirota bacterium]
MEKRFILFLVLAFAIMIAYPYFIKKLGFFPSPQPSGQPDRFKDNKPLTEKPKEVSVAQAPPTTSEPREEKTVQVDTGLYRAVFSSRGGKLMWLELKNYTGSDRKTPIKLYEWSPGTTAAFSIQTVDAGLNSRLDQESYSVEGRDIALDEQNKTGQISFRYLDPASGMQISKRFVFSGDDYRIALDIETTAFPNPYLLSLGTNFGITDWGQKGRFVGFIGPVTLLDGELKKDDPAKMEREVRHQGPVVWTALQDKYFIAAAIPTDAAAAVVSRASPTAVNTAVEFPSDGSGPVAHHVLLYVGPKEHRRLQSLGVKLEETVDFGWFIYGSWAIVRFIARPLFHVLQFFHGFTGNYGVAIILLTVGVRGIFIPLSHKSYRSMKDMQALQPQLQVLQKKHKDDKQRLQKEMMELYQKQKVNPLGGCLPMLLQIPVFVALFNVLYTTIEIRQAPFMFWIRDLSDKDPFFVLPILMGLTMVIQQKMQPTTMDPIQAKLFLMMPVFMTFLFLNFSSGLVLYMLTNNTLTISQQYFTMKYFEKPHEKASGKKGSGQKPDAGQDSP